MKKKKERKKEKAHVLIYELFALEILTNKYKENN
jgi:uncharacterized protein YhhL (DUF1145 family)